MLLLCISSVFAFQNHIALVDNIFYSKNYESCSDHSLIEISYFSGKYHHRERLMEFEMSGKSSVNDKIMSILNFYPKVKLKKTVTFLFTVHEKIHINQTYDPCVIKIPGLCSISSTPYFLTKGVLPLSAEKTNVSEFFFNIPDFEGKVYFYFHSTVTGEEIGCLKTSIVNKQSFRNNIITWICLGFFGLSAFISFMAFSSQSSFSYALLAASHSIPGLLAFWSYFQFLASITMENVIYPTSLIAWASNFSFSLGLIKFFQELIYLFNKFSEKHIHLTLGNVKEKQNNNKFVLSNSYQGIQGQLNYLKIANTNAFITSITCFVSAVLGFLVISTIACLITRIIRRNEIFIRRNWINFNLWSILRLLVINIFGISFISIYQLALHDTYQPKILSTLSLLVFVVPILILSSLHFFRSHFRKLDSEMTAKYWGWLIVEYNSKRQHFYLVFFIYSLCKAFLLGLFNFPSKAQTISLSAVELLYLLSILILFPFESIRAYTLELLLGAIKTSCLGIIITFSFNISELSRALLGMTIIMISTIGLLTLFIFTLWNFIIVFLLATYKDHINYDSFETNTLSDRIHNYKQKIFKHKKFGKVFGYDQYLYPQKKYYTYSSQSSDSTLHNSEKYYIKQYPK
ncbi:hypothetical protein PNEG_00474 [Pneumocystis murina B123]|uniref:ML-like domain-containing protein n=1 Tax=Pneumocystis murina (strain B123) TaxID=1069680 RepID=M7NWD6_PNEMU|nr:hypothetical protein PNEG_00474 [Pneumocystis murina B123]EMR11456.1 hypothetical protein PNEG_00474 [Pneumocystis murina B123]